MFSKNRISGDTLWRPRRRFEYVGWLALLLAVLLGVAETASAQLATADILGTVSDSTGASLPNAKVILMNVDTHDQRVAQTSGTGDYTFTLLPVGHYSITVSASGFKTSTTTGIAVEAGDRSRQDVHLEVGGATETVEVETQTPLLQADSATVSSTVTPRAVQDLPLNGRNLVQLVQLVPGANEGPGNGLTSGGRPDDRRSTSGFSVNGQDDTLNNYVIDGIDDNERIIGTIGVKPNVEGIEEITVQTNSYAPEAGRTAGGVVNMVTKSGTNQFHGTAYEFFRNDAMDARNVFQTTGREPELRQNQYGASLGGPIIRNRTFFFGDYEGFRLVSGVTYTSSVPTLAEYNNINSINGGSPQAIVNTGNGTQGQTISPVALNYLKLFPAPNVGTPGQVGSNYTISPNKTQNSNLFDIRVDHRFNANNMFFGRYNYNKVDTYTPAALPAAPNGIIAGGGRWNFSGPATDGGQQYAFGFTHVFTQNLVTDLRAAYTRINNLSVPLNYGTNADTKVGFPPNMNFNQLTSGLTPIQIGSLSDLGDGAYVPLQDIDGTYQYSGTVSYTHSVHTLKMGASLIRRQARNVQSAFPFGQYTFGLSTDSCAPGTGLVNGNCASAGSLTQVQNNNLASFLVGGFTTSARNYNLFAPDYRSWEPSFFAQDSWKVNPRLTLIYGLRYDVFTPFTEAHNHISNFDYGLALGSTASTIGSALKVAGVNASSTADIGTTYSNVAPRLGFAFSATPHTVVRGGYGISYFPGNYTSNAALKNAPFTSVYSPNCSATIGYQIQTGLGASPTSINPACSAAAGQPTVFDQGLPLPVPQTINSQSLSFVAEDPKLRPAMIQQFNLQVQEQIGPNVFTIGYVGNIGQHLPETINDINVPRPNNIGLSRPLNGLLPNLGGVGWLQSGGVSNYNGLQTSVQRRFVNGLAFDVNYTWSHALSDVTGFSEEGQQGWSNADPTRIRAIEYGNAENDIRNRFAVSVNYELPGKDFRGPARWVIGGWQTNLIGVWQSGKPFTIVNGTGNGGFSNRSSPLYNGVVDRPNLIHSPSHAPAGYYFDPTAFAPQTLGTVGTESRNSLYGPHFRHFDLSLFKDFPLTERAKLQFRAEAFNFSNTPNFYMNNNVNSSPGTVMGNGSFGQITQYDPNYVPRQLQLALKLQF